MTQTKKSKMLLGFNHNIKHKGKIYHVQTEDSGVDNPHIITHLFVGGNILASKKTSYADIVHAANFIDVVRELMEEQHKAMLRNLVNGVYDDLESAPAVHDLPASQMVFPKSATNESAIPQTSVGLKSPGSLGTARSPFEVKPLKPITTHAPAKQVTPTKHVPETSAPAQKPISPPERPPRAVPPRHPVRPMPGSEAPTQVAMPAFGAAKKKPALGTQIYTSIPSEMVPTKQEPHRVTLKPNQAGTAANQVPPAAQDHQELPPEVLAARRMVERPTPKDTSGPTIFGEDLISEKSLDEVILGYLAGEGENGS